MRDDDELRLPAHIREHFVEAADVGFVERRVHFVEDAERARLVAEHRDQQRERRQRLFAAGEQQNILQALAGRLRHDIDARIAGAVRLAEAHFAVAAAEERLEGDREMALMKLKASSNFCRET